MYDYLHTVSHMYFGTFGKRKAQFGSEFFCQVSQRYEKFDKTGLYKN